MIEIPIQTEKDRFLKHISKPYNNKIIFSGIFGIGKTFFLNDFFKDNTDDFDAYFISPVNYSIATNKDIFKYIKFDISFELLSKQVAFEREFFDLKYTLPFYAKDNGKEIIKTILKFSGKLGKGIKDISEVTGKVLEHNKNLKLDEKKEIIDYLKTVSETEGSIYENDLITELLNEKISNTKKEKKAVLVIDDLDRLDPEHIFRILNVFTSQLDSILSFDKIILVCDINNVKNIFQSKYGSKTSFSGYIDKFFDNEIFYFDNKEFISNKLDEILSTINISPNTKKFFNINDTNLTLIKIIKDLLIDLINNNLINLRALLKFQEQEFNFKIHKFKLKNNYKDTCNCQFNQIIIFEFLLSLYGEMSGLEYAINKLSEINLTTKYSDIFKHIYGHLFLLIDYKNNQLYKNIFFYENQELNLKIKYEVNTFDPNINSFIAELKSIKIDEIETTMFLPYGKLLKIAFEKYIEIKNNKA